MEYEIDFLAVGEESKGGDAIALRYGNLHGPRSEQTVIVIDGGYSDCGLSLVELVRTHYNTTRADIVLSTHPDQDHVTGLEVVLEELEVGQLVMHQPWRHSEGLSKSRAIGFQSAMVTEKLQKSLQEASDLENIAVRKGIPIVEPFQGTATGDGCFRVLGPSVDYYEELLANVQSPATIKQHMTEFLAKAKEAVSSILVKEDLLRETLREDGITSAQNNTSVISMLDIGGRRSLFTGDAGIPALHHALDVLEAEGFVPGSLRFVQVPHHGSRRNVSPSVLDRLLGPKGKTPDGNATAFISAPKKNPEHKHPAKKVTNAFHRRGYGVHPTQGASLRHNFNAPPRDGYSAVDPLPFYQMVEEDSES